MVELCLYQGTINTLTNVASFCPVRSIEVQKENEYATETTIDGGSFRLETLDEFGKVISTVAFDPETDGDGSASSIFLVANKCDTGVAQVRLLGKQSTVLASLSASPSVPSVELLYPNGGESLVGDHVEIQWTGTDPEGDENTYDVTFSGDGGETWSFWHWKCKIQRQFLYLFLN